MKDLEINIAISKAVGMTDNQITVALRLAELDKEQRRCRRDSFSGWGIASEIKKLEYSKDYLGLISDYVHDLNAMHRAELILTQAQATEYYHLLSVYCFHASLDSGSRPSQRWIFHATAAQKATAFVRALGLWKD